MFLHAGHTVHLVSSQVPLLVVPHEASSTEISTWRPSPKNDRIGADTQKALGRGRGAKQRPTAANQATEGHHSPSKPAPRPGQEAVKSGRRMAGRGSPEAETSREGAPDRSGLPRPPLQAGTPHSKYSAAAMASKVQQRGRGHEKAARHLSAMLVRVLHQNPTRGRNHTFEDGAAGKE